MITFPTIMKILAFVAGVLLFVAVAAIAQVLSRKLLGEFLIEDEEEEKKDTE